ncbi:MAG: hypothetical protein V4635_03195 [Bacteroidota bacterium]
MESTQAPDNGKTVAIISYITLIGWIIALIIHSGNKTRLGAYHLRQTLGLMILIVCVGILGYILYFIPMGWAIKAALNIGLLVFWIIGLVSAISGDEKPLPIVGGLFQKWFAGFAL